MAVVSALRTWSFGWLLLLFGSLGFAAAWILLGSVRNSYCSWMAVLAAVVAALLLRLARVPAGAGRALAAAAATLVSAAVAYWVIIATWVGSPLGLLPWESATRLGLEHAALMLELGIDRVDIAWLGAAVVVALAAAPEDERIPALEPDDPFLRASATIRCRMKDCGVDWQPPRSPRRRRALPGLPVR